jgi:superfamily II DNA/RNA helicase
MAEEAATFAQFSHIISPLILRALEDLGFSRPTLVQQKAIPLALENHDVLARARTGSGKTAAYCIPLVQKILNAKAAAAVGALGAYLIVVQDLLSSSCHSRALGRGRFAAAVYQGTYPRAYP